MSSQMRVFIVDDEAPARRKLLRFLAADKSIEVVGEAANGRDAVEGISRAAPDLLFLDVQMPDFDGFEVIRRLKPPQPQIVFVTAFDQYAIRAFDVHAFGYLLKPFDEPRFRKVLNDAKHRSQTYDDETLRKLMQHLDRAARPPVRLLVEQGERSFFVSPDEIDWVESERNHLLIHVSEKTYTVRKTMDAFEEILGRRDFLRVNRSALVRLDAVRELQKWFHGEYKVILTSGATLTWTRRYLGRQDEVLRKL